MARRIRPFVEREAVWAFVLACLGFVSMYATLPAAVVLAARTIRRRVAGGTADRSRCGYRGSSIANREPTLGVLSAVIRPPSASTIRFASASPNPAPAPLRA